MAFRLVARTLDVPRMKSITQDLERNIHKSQPPIVTMIKSATNNLPQSIVKKKYELGYASVNRNPYPKFSVRPAVYIIHGGKSHVATRAETLRNNTMDCFRFIAVLYP